MASFFPSCTEQEEIEIATARLEPDETSGASGDRLHVLVEKHRGSRDRKPTASSPRAPLPSADQQPRCECCRSTIGSAGGASTKAARMLASGKNVTLEYPVNQDKHQTSKLFGEACIERDDGLQPALVEVYRFECGDAQYMSTAGAAPPSACERLAGRGTRAAAAAVSGLAGAVGALLALPALLALAVQSAALRSVRGVTASCVQSVSDYALKPALAVTFNAALRPVLVFVQQVASAVHEAVRPVALTATDCMEPVVRLVAAFRLVEVRLAPRCTCHTGALHAL